MTTLRARSRRLPDHICPKAHILFVGINPGLRSAAVGHHFAGASNRFWKLLFDSGLVDQRLTPRELEVARLIGLGASNRDVAQTLVVSLGTVKKHLNNIFLKLEVQSRTQAVARARELGLL